MDKIKLIDITERFKNKKILVIGDIMLDKYIWGGVSRISPEAPVPVLKIIRTEYGCGGAGSVAANLAALGAKPYCIAVIGQDENGEILKKMLDSAGK